MSTHERDPHGIPPKTPGAKLDAGKPAVFEGLIDYFPRACLGVAQVSQFGASKYSWKGWESVKNGIQRYANALIRHFLYESLSGEGHFSRDQDSGCFHADHEAWNALARAELIHREWELRSRSEEPKNVRE